MLAKKTKSRGTRKPTKGWFCEEDEGLGLQGPGPAGTQAKNQNYYSICVPVNPDAVTEIIANNESYISKVIKFLCAGTLFF